jgi:hypothetical protein
MVPYILATVYQHVFGQFISAYYCIDLHRYDKICID